MSNTNLQPLTIYGKILEIGTITSSENWKKQDFTIVTVDEYPKQINVHVWNSAIEQLERCKINDLVTCRINISSRKHEGRYYTEVTCWRIEVDFNSMRKEVTPVVDNNQTPF